MNDTIENVLRMSLRPKLEQGTLAVAGWTAETCQLELPAGWSSWLTLSQWPRSIPNHSTANFPGPMELAALFRPHIAIEHGLETRAGAYGRHPRHGLGRAGKNEPRYD